MIISKGKFLDNRTKKYLLPAIVTELGKVFKQKFNTEIFKLAVGLHDTLLENNILKNKKALFFLVDKTYLPKEFEKFKNWIKYKDYYITDYQYEEDKHMFVIEVPKQLEEVYNKFNLGDYSKMYSKKEVEKYFNILDSAYPVITKDVKLLPIFLNKVRKEFQVEVFEKDFIDAEYDFPPSIDIKNEIFNYEEK